MGRRRRDRRRVTRVPAATREASQPSRARVAVARLVHEGRRETEERRIPVRLVGKSRRRKSRVRPRPESRRSGDAGDGFQDELAADVGRISRSIPPSRVRAPPLVRGDARPPSFIAAARRRRQSVRRRWATTVGRGAPVASSPYDAHRAGRLATRLARERRPANDTVAFPLTRRARAAPQWTGATRGWRVSRRRRSRRRRARRLGRGVLLRRRRAVARVRRHRRGARLQRAAARAAPRAHARRGRRLPIDRVAGERRFALASVRDVDGGFVDWRRRRFHRGRLERRWGGSVRRWVRGRAVVVRRRRVVRGAAVGDGGQGCEREDGFGESRGPGGEDRGRRGGS